MKLTGTYQISISQKANITFIGDDFQSIYRRRGAQMENFLNLQKYRYDMKTYKLQINYRSKSHIVHAGSHIISHNAKQYTKDIKHHRDSRDKVIVVTTDDEIDEAKHSIDLIEKIHKEKDRPWSDFAILYRKNSQSSSYEQLLISRGIPYRIYGGHKFLDRKEIKDILAYLKFVYNRSDNISLKRIINMPSRGISEDTLNKIENYAISHNISIRDVCIDRAILSVLGISSRAIESISSFVRKIFFIINDLDSYTVSSMIEYIINSFGYKDRLLKDKDGQDRLDNIGELINLSTQTEYIKADGVDEDSDIYIQDDNEIQHKNINNINMQDNLNNSLMPSFYQNSLF